MMMKVSDYIAEFFVERGIEDIFTVVGGGAMHMNDSFGHHEKLHCVYNHHEQASAMAAEAYFRVKHKMAGLCVTSGPGAINALNGVAGAFQDSIPMIVVSGQTKTTLMTRSSGLDLRTLGNQEFDIMSTLSKIAKYYESVMTKDLIRYCLEKAFYLAQSGRPGPSWLEIPIDIQGSMVDPDKLVGYDPSEEPTEVDSQETLNDKINLIFQRLSEAKRPVIYAGNGVRISGGQEALLELAKTAGIPVVTCWDSVDLIETENPLYAGRAGIMGDRPGNFAVQNSDLLIAVGNRLNIYQVGYQLESWARGAYVVDVDIDPLELIKPTIRVDLPVCCDAGLFLETFCGRLKAAKWNKGRFESWAEQCRSWKEKYPVVEKRHYRDESPVNVYALIDTFSRKLPEGMVTVVANGSASVVGSAAYYIKKDQRFIMNCAISSMGYELPAAVGACVANDEKPVVCVAGDGSIMMNLQELQTIATNKLPVKILLINNDGYQQIRLTQTNLFHKNFVGIGPESRDLGFPDFGLIANAFGLQYRKVSSREDLEASAEWLLKQDGPSILEAICTTEQIFEPKSATKRLEDGSLYSPPLEDLAPFLPREELEQNMYIEMWDKSK